MTTLFTLARRASVVLLGALMLSTSARAERTRGEADRPAVLTPEAAAAMASANVAECTLGSSIVNIDVNNVRAELYNIGGLFWRGSGALYEVPKGGGVQSIFASGIWMAGLVDPDGDGMGDPATDLRFAGQTYSSWEYWPGPLDENGETTQGRCNSFDKLWSVYFDDIAAFSSGTPEGTVVNGREVSFQDLQTWPIAQGAPFYVDTNGNNRRDVTDSDGDGVEDEPRIELTIGDPGYSLTLGGGRQIDLANGERPDIIGDQSVWWVMNDNGNAHGWSGKPALEMEVRAQAFAFKTADAINNTTFYRYQFHYRGPVDLVQSYIALWSDPDLGNFGDDYVGSDLDLGLGFVYNGDNNDEGAGGYGLLPPALGYDFFQGPLVNNDGLDNDGDGETDEEDERLEVETFFYFTNQGGPTGDPASGEDRGLVSYRYMRGLWKDGVPMTIGGDGYNPGSDNVTRFAFPGDPPAFWSEYNSDGLGRANLPDDRRFGVATGPFTFEPGDVQELVFGIVWSVAPQECQSTATPQIASLQQLKFDDITVQGAFNANFNLPNPPPAVTVTATPLDQEIILDFESITGDNSDIFEFEVESPFAGADAPDQTYNFEGFQIFQYRGPNDTNGTLIATYDLNNSVTTIIDSRLDCDTGTIITGVVAQGANTGTATNTPTSISIENDVFTSEPLRNNTTYYFGVQPYAYNEFSSPNRVFAAPVTRVEVRPSLADARNDGTVIQAQTGFALPAQKDATGGGIINARVTNPTQLVDATYRVEFFTQLDENGEPATDEDDHVLPVNYRIVRTLNGVTETVLDGEEYYQQTGDVLLQNTDVLRLDGLAFDVRGPDPGPFFPGGTNAFVEVQGPGGFDSCNDPMAGSTAGCTSELGFNNIYSSFNGTGDYIGYHIGAGPEDSIGGFAPNEYEIRFTEGGGYAVHGFTTDNVHPVPFEVWDIGLTPPGVENDPSDDVRMIPFLFSDNSTPDDRGPECAEQYDYTVDSIFGLGLVTQRLYMYYPKAGQSYDDFEAAAVADLAGADCGVSVAAYDVADTGRGRPIQRFVMEQGDARYVGRAPLGINELTGTIIRFYSTDPNQPGDVYTFNTADYRRVSGDAATAEAALDLIAITPNPYRGRSEYELGGEDNIVRFVNLPAQATLRVFTLSGTLLRTIEKPNDGSTTIDWNLQTEARLPVASGIYLIHVDARRADGSSIGERVLKFAVIQRRVQLDVF